MRPLRINFVEENELTAQAEIDRMLEERKNLTNSQPKILKELGLAVQLTGYFSMVDGKMINFLYKNKCQSTCPFDLTTCIIF